MLVRANVGSETPNNVCGFFESIAFRHSMMRSQNTANPAIPANATQDIEWASGFPFSIRKMFHRCAVNG